MVNKLRENVTAQVMRVEVQMRSADDLDDLPDEDDLPDMEAHHIDAFTGEDDVGEGMLLIDMEQDGEVTLAIDPKDPSTWGKIARNEPCPCGSGKKYKHCHGAFA